MFVREIRGTKRTVYDVYYTMRETDEKQDMIARFDSLTSAVLVMKFIRGDNLPLKEMETAVALLRKYEEEKEL